MYFLMIYRIIKTNQIWDNYSKYKAHYCILPKNRNQVKNKQNLEVKVGKTQDNCSVMAGQRQMEVRKI